MLGTRNLFFIAAAVICVLAPVASAEPFIDDQTAVTSSFDDSFQGFNDSLDNTASRMRRDYDYSNLSAAHRNLVNAQANALGPQQDAQNQFNNTQASMVLSGGSYNSNGSYGYGAAMGLGGMMGMGMGMGMGGGGGGNVAPDNWGASGNGNDNFTAPRRFRGRYYAGSGQ
ncbi:MAG: hypothetical protein K2X27_16560 [Candidatus Obscuribacterales bacterium]|nr:hypothetical protein [Candidatus Obscuribacterales bacterium]